MTILQRNFHTQFTRFNVSIIQRNSDVTKKRNH